MQGRSCGCGCALSILWVWMGIVSERCELCYECRCVTLNAGGWCVCLCELGPSSPAILAGVVFVVRWLPHLAFPRPNPDPTVLDHITTNTIPRPGFVTYIYSVISHGQLGAGVSFNHGAIWDNMIPFDRCTYVCLPFDGRVDEWT